MDDETAERIHKRIDETHTLINDIRVDMAGQKRDGEHLIRKIDGFISKVEDQIFHPEDGCMTKNKSSIKVQGNQVKLQWGLLFILLTGLLGVIWANLPK